MNKKPIVDGIPTKMNMSDVSALLPRKPERSVLLLLHRWITAIRRRRAATRIKRRIILLNSRIDKFVIERNVIEARRRNADKFKMVGIGLKHKLNIKELI